MSHFKKKRQQVFLLSRLKLTDFLVFLIAIVLVTIVLIVLPRINSVISELNTALEEYSPPTSDVPPRAIQMTHNITYLWHKDNLPLSGENYQFFTPGQNVLVFPTGTKTERGAYQFWLTAVDMTNGHIRWQTETPQAYEIRIYDDRLFVLSPGGKFVLSNLSFPDASVLNNQELPYCSFGGSSLLSTYHLGSGKLLWGYTYYGVLPYELYFNNNQVFITNTGDHGQSGLVATVDISSGQIIRQACGRIWHREPNPAASIHQGIEFGTSGATMRATSKDNSSDEYFCGRDGPYCFVTEGRRLDLLDAQTQQLLGYILFEGADLTDYMIRIVRQNQYIVVYLEDSNQLFGFRYR